MNDKYKVLLADDHKIITDGLRYLVKASQKFEIVAVADTGKKVLQLLDSFQVDIVVMDIRMPELNGIDATKIIKEKLPDIKILILSTYDSEGYIKNAIEAGADGYLLKEEGQDQLIEAMEKLLEGHTWFSQRVTDKFIRRIQKTGDSNGIVLTERETEVLKLLADGFTSEEIGDRLAMSKHTADVFRKNLIFKFQAKNASELIKKAYTDGYLIY